MTTDPQDLPREMFEFSRWFEADGGPSGDRTHGHDERFTKPGDVVAISAGISFGVAGNMNLLKPTVV
jgi:hypothetical protein